MLHKEIQNNSYPVRTCKKCCHQTSTSHEFKIKKAAIKIWVSVFSVLLKAEKEFWNSSDVLVYLILTEN